jgi:hypothetical protein
VVALLSSAAGAIAAVALFSSADKRVVLVAGYLAEQAKTDLPLQ